MKLNLLFTPFALAIVQGNLFASAFFHDWTVTGGSGGSPAVFTNVSSAGSIVGTTTVPGFGGVPGTWGLPTAITSQPPLNTALSVGGTTGLGTSLDFAFSSGYDWGTGGELIIGNIHNYFEYSIEAWDFGNNPIDVNLWPILAEYPSSSPGTLGYFSTSTTDYWDNGFARHFFVLDSLADGNSGQGGVVHLNGLLNVGRIRLTLTDSSLGPNAQSGDLILFNVGTPTPEPGSAATLAAGLIAALLLRRRLRSILS